MRSRQATSKQVSPVSPPPNPLPKSDAKGKTHKEKGQQRSPKKRKITPESKMGSGAAKRKKTPGQVEEVNSSPSFHSSQTQGVESVLPSFSRRSPGGPLGPLSGYSEFICVHLFLDSRQHI